MLVSFSPLTHPSAVHPLPSQKQETPFLKQLDSSASFTTRNLQVNKSSIEDCSPLIVDGEQLTVNGQRLNRNHLFFGVPLLVKLLFDCKEKTHPQVEKPPTLFPTPRSLLPSYTK
ncbi:hypothetical protein GNE10_15135 [Nostoc sp. 2RC]|nr:hypothetical protein [Nostoc sp. 2RC]